VGECFFWYRPTRVVPDQRPLKVVVVVVVVKPVLNYLYSALVELFAILSLLLLL